MRDFSRALQHLRPRPSPQRLLFQQDSPVSSLSLQLGFLKAGASRPQEDAALPDGVEETTAFGRHLVIRNVYDGAHEHGKVQLGRFSRGDLQRLAAIMKEDASVPDRDAIVFVDTETTGVHGGTGMVPFLVGLGFFAADDFHMVQFFMRDFDEEPSMLLAIGETLRRFQLAVTYNGATFDIPLLESRFTLARLENPFASMSHLDLLPAARRLWRNAHGSCRLVALESAVVSFLRGPDIPGGMIPRAYFDFVHGRGRSVLGGVLKHNVHDVLSLAALAVCAADRVVNEPAALDNPLELFSLARVFENTNEWRRAVDFYERGIAGGLPETFLFKARENLSVLCRRAGDHSRALAICEELLAGPKFSPVAHEGAAIHYERIARTPARALEIVERALERLEDCPENKRNRDSLLARRERLRQKAIQF